MSGTTSPSNDIISDFSNQSDESAKKNETSNIVETNTNESLHLGSDLLAEKLDYEIDEEPDELEEQEEIDESILDSPINDKDTSQDVDNHDTDSKTDDLIPNKDDQVCVTDTSTANVTTNGEKNNEKGDLSNLASENAQNGTDSSADVRSNVKKDYNAVEAVENEAPAKSTKSSNERKSTEIECDEELEEGEVSDEDEEARKERLKPQPVCRFYSKGACTWGSSCRFIHPGVLDTGR